MKFIKSKILTTVMLLLTVIMYIFVLVLTIRTSQQTVDIRTPYMFLEGEYSIDDAEFKAFDPNEPINEPFKKIVFRGRFNKEKRAHFKEIAFTTKNMWYTMYTEDHEVICTNSYMTLDEWMQQYFEGSSEEEIAEKRENHIKYLRKVKPFKFNMIHRATPPSIFRWRRSSTNFTTRTVNLLYHLKTRILTPLQISAIFSP